MGRRKTHRACATIPSMLSSARGAPELLHRAAVDAEVSAASAGAAGSEAAGPGDRGGRNRSGRGSSATTSSPGVAEGAERRGESPARKPDPEPGRMDHHQPGTGRYQVLHNEEDNSESSAVEQPSTSNPAPQVVQSTPSAAVLETDSSPPPYSSITVEVPTTSDTEVYSEFYPVPPPYSVATSLPTYDEAEKAKAAAMAAAAAETSQRIQEEECPPRDDFSDADQLRVGNDGIFMLAFFTEDFHVESLSRRKGWKRRYFGQLEQCDLRHKSKKICLIWVECGIYFQLAWILFILLYHQYHSWKIWCHLWIWPFIDQMDPHCQVFRLFYWIFQWTVLALVDISCTWSASFLQRIC
uniref:Nedd4 family interacting protein 2 n=1 Tax=Equus caballus TaxID=9796 RepID=F6VAT2_HORSE